MPGIPSARRPALTGVSPSTSLSGRMVATAACSSRWPGSGSWSEDAVDRFVGIELTEQRFHFLLRGIGGQAVLETLHAGRDGRLALRPDIDRACRIFADQHHRKPGHAARRRLKRRNRIGDPRPQARGESLAVDHTGRLPGRHHSIPLAAAARAI